LIRIADSFHLSIPMLSRCKSNSTVINATYISYEEIINEWDEITHDYNESLTSRFDWVLTIKKIH